MKGTLQVYENFGDSNQKLVMEEHNLIVDSAAEIVTDMLSMPSSLSVGTGASNLFDTSNYVVNALSFGKALPQFEKNAHIFSPRVVNFLSDSNNFTSSGIRVVEWNRNLLARNFDPLSGNPSAVGYFIESSGGWVPNLSTSASVSGAPDAVGGFGGNTLYSMSAPLAYAQRNILVEGNNWADVDGPGSMRTPSSLTRFNDWSQTNLVALTDSYADYMGAHNARDVYITASAATFTNSKLATYGDGSGFILSGIQPEVNTNPSYSLSVYYKVSSIPEGLPPDLNSGPEFSATMNSTISLALTASSFSIPSEDYNWWQKYLGYNTNDLNAWTLTTCTRDNNASTGPDLVANSILLDATSNGGNTDISYPRTQAALYFANLGRYLTEGRFAAQQLYIKKSLADPPTAATRLEVYNTDAAESSIGNGLAVELHWDGVSEGTSSLAFYRDAAPNATGSELRGYSLVEEATNGFYRVVIVTPIEDTPVSDANRRYRIRLYPGGTGGQGSVYVNNYQIFEIPTKQFFTLQFPNGPVTLTRNPYGDKYRTDLMLKNGVEVFPGPPAGDGTTYPYDNTEGEANVWRRAVHTTSFSSTPHLFYPQIYFGFARENDNYEICNPQLESTSKASIWTDSSTVTIHKGIDDDGLALVEASAIPMADSGGVIDKELCFSVYVNPSGFDAPQDLPSDLGAGMSLRLMGEGGLSGTSARTLTKLAPGSTTYVRGNHKTTFTQGDSVGAAIYVSGVSSNDHFHLANAQLEYDGTIVLPEDDTVNGHGQATPTSWVSSIGTSTINAWDIGTKIDGQSMQVSTIYEDIIEGPYPGTSGALILNNSDVSTLSLQQRIVGRNATVGVTSYSTTPFYDKKLTASIYVKYPFEDPPGVIPDASGSTTGLARRSEIALYPGIATGDIARIHTESGYENGGRVIIRWTDADGVQSPGAGSAVIDNDILDGTAADGTLEYIRNGWYRVSVTNKTHAYTVANTSSVVFSVYPVARMYTDMHGSPNSASGGLYVYGSQLQLGDHSTNYKDSSAFYGLTPGPFVSFSGEFPEVVKARDDFDWSGTLATSTVYVEQDYNIKNASGINLVQDNLEFVSENWVSSNITVINLRDSQYPPDTDIAPVLFIPSQAESYMYQDITSSALNDGKTYVLSLFLRRKANVQPPAGIEFITQMFSPGGKREAAMGFDWNTSAVSAAPMADSTVNRVGTFALHPLDPKYGGGKNWFRMYLTFPYIKSDGNGDIRIKLYPWGSNTTLKNKYGGYIAKAILQPADTSSYIPEGFLPDYADPLDTTLVDDYTLPMASAMDFSSTFNQNLNFLAFRNSSSVSVSSFKNIEIVPHHNPNSSSTENDLSGALGMNAYYFGCFPDGSATPNNVAIVSSLDTAQGLSNPVATGTFGGYFNQCSAMDPSGFVKVWPDQKWHDKNVLYLTSGMVTSSNLDFSTTGEIIYISTVASGDLGMANMYGGITQLGLWGYDVRKMLNDNRLPPYSFLPPGGSDKPVGNDLLYKMICKKVLNRNLTQILDSSGPGLTQYRDLTLVWRLNFL